MAPRPSLICRTLVLIAIIIPLTTSADQFIPQGWVKAKIQNTMYYASKGDSLPSFWSCDVVDSVATRAATNRGAALKSNQIATVKNTTFGEVYAGYKIKTTQHVSVSGDAVVSTTYIGSATAFAKSEKVGGEASGAGKASHFAEALARVSTPMERERADGPRARNVQVMTTGNQWVTEPDGTKSTTVTLQFPKLWAMGSVKNPTGGGGTWIALVANGSAEAKIYPSKLTFQTVGPNTLNGNTQSFLTWLCVDVYSLNNVPLNNHTLNVINGAVVMDFGDYNDGTYNLYAWAKGTLRKRVQISYSSSLGVAGLNFDLKFGDLDGDNYVSSDEANFVLANVGLDVRLSDAWFGDPFSNLGYRPGDADLDEDGFVTLNDYALASANVGQYGD